MEESSEFKLYTLEEIGDMDMTVEWVWEPRIPRGYVTLLAAKGGTGKSGFALWLANKLASEGKNILYVDGENTLGHMSDRSKEWALQHKKNIFILGKKNVRGRIEGKYPGVAKVTAMAIECKAELVIVDSLMKVSTGREMLKEKDAVIFMDEMGNIANEINGAVLLLCHTNKELKGDDFIITAQDIHGSHAISDMSRSSLLMFSDLKDDSKKTIRHGKYNFSPPADDLLFTLTEKGITNIREVPPPRACKITTGNSGCKSDEYNSIALPLALDGATKKQIRKTVKDSGASEMEASRVITWLKTEHNIVYE